MQGEDVFSFHSHWVVRKDLVFKLEAAEIQSPVPVHIRFILKEDNQVVIQDFVKNIEAFNFIRRYDIFDDCGLHSPPPYPPPSRGRELRQLCLDNDVA